MNKDSKRNTFKKFTAVLLASTMLALGITQGSSPVMAENTPDLVADADTSNSYVSEFKGNTKNVGRVWTDKSVKRKDSSEDFQITMSALTSVGNFKKTSYSSKPIDFTLVLDVSGSMSYDINGDKIKTKEIYIEYNGAPKKDVKYYQKKSENEYERLYVKDGKYYTDKKYNKLYEGEVYEKTTITPSSRMALLKQATNSFLDRVGTENVGKPEEAMNRVSVVQFAYGKNSKENNQAKVLADFSSDVENIKKNIDKLVAKGSTHADHGMELAVKQNDKSIKQRPDGKRVVIFFTDGEPNHYNDFWGDVAASVIESAETIKKTGTDIYSVGMFANADTTISFDANKGYNWEDLQKKENLGKKEAFNAYLQAVSSNFSRCTAKGTSNHNDNGSELKSSTLNILFGEKNNSGDYYQKADLNNSLDKIFQSILDEANKDSGYSTEVDTVLGANHSGYITFEDTLGDFMELKSADGVKIEGKLVGKVNFNSTTNSYSVSGTAKMKDAAKPTDPETNVNLSDIKITYDKGTNTVTTKVPARLIPFWYYDIKKDASEKLTGSEKEAQPIRILYTVGLRGDVKRAMATGNYGSVEGLSNYISKQMTEESNRRDSNLSGKVAFYSNKWEYKFNDERRMPDALAHFVPATGNDFYYYVNKEYVYSDKECTKNLKDISDFEKVQGYIKKDGYVFENNTVKESSDIYYVDDIDQTNCDVDEHGVFVKQNKLERFDYFEKSRKLKNEGNLTNTAKSATAPYWNHYQSGQERAEIWLGNNGRIAYNAAGTLEVLKTVEDLSKLADPEQAFTFNITFNKDANTPISKEVIGKVVNMDGTPITPSLEEVVIRNGEGTFTLKANQKIVFTSVPYNTIYKITEQSVAGYVPKQNNLTGTIKDTSQPVSVSFTNTFTPTEIGGDPDPDPSGKPQNKNTLLHVVKTLDGKVWEDETFEFTISQKADDEVKAIMPANTKVSVNKDKQDGYFDVIKFTKEGTYNFIVKETKTNIPGMKEAVEQTLRVVVGKDEKGNLKITDPVKDVTFNFKNKFVPATYNTETTEFIDVTKVFTGREGNEWLDTDEFTFEIKLENKEDEPYVTFGDNKKSSRVTISNENNVNCIKNGKGMVRFTDPITFTKPGRYKFSIRELEPTDKNGISYDLTPQYVVINVQENENGSLTAAKDSSSDDRLIFNNTYSTTSVSFDTASLNIKKDVSGPTNLVSGMFDFTLTNTKTGESTSKTLNTKNEENGDVNFGTITFTEKGTYCLVIKEVIPDPVPEGWTYDGKSIEYIVEVKDTNDGHLTCEVKPKGDKKSFKNVYDPTKATISVPIAKQMDGRTWRDGDKFTFTITPEKKYEGLTEYSKTVTISNNDQGETSENTERLKNANFTFDKPGVYKFIVTENPTNIRGVKIDSDPKLIEIEVKDEGGHYVAVANPEGLTFTNKYAPEKGTEVDPNPDPDSEKDPTNPEQTLVGFVKNLEGRNWKEDETFTFELEQTSGPKVDGKNYQESVKVTKDNRKAVFNKLTYTPEMMEDKKEQVFTYTVKEVVPSNVDNGLTYDKHVVDIKVIVTDMNDGTLKATMTQSGSHVFINTYNPGEVPVDPTKDPEKEDTSIGLPFEKVLIGREWKNTDQFQFQLEAITENAPMPESGKEITTITSPKQKFNFGTITFTAEDMKDAILQEDGITRIQSFSYKVTEIVPEEKDRIPGITYASNEVIFKIDVIDAGTGKLEARVAKTDVNGTTTFENIFEANRIYDDKDGKSGLRIVKTLTGHDMVNGQFTFDVKASNDNAKDKLGKESLKVVTVGDRVAGEPVELTPLAELVFDEKDIDKDFKFEITEQAKPAEGYDGYVYSTEKYEVNIHVEERDGKLIPITTINQGNPIEGSVAKVTFENTFSAEGILNDTKEDSVRIEANKVLVGRDMKENEFKFEVVDKNDSVVATGTNMKDGTITFTEMKFDTKKLVDDAKAEVAGHVMGTNTYTYEYTVREVQPTADKVVMETPAFNITVDVIVNDNGTLDFHVVYSEGTNRLTFVNTYAPTEVELDINGRKTLKTPKGSQMTLKDIAGKFTFNIVSEGADFTPKVIEQPEVVEVEEVVSEELVKDVEEVVEEMTEEVTEEVNEELAEEKVVAEEVVQPMVVDPYGYLPTQQSATNDVAGNVSFGKVRFDVNALNGVEPDEDGKRTITFKYRVDESGSVHGITNAESQHFSIVVADDGNGILDARLVGQSGAFVFENVYSFQPTSSSVTSTIEFTKELTGRNLVDGEFNFMMHEVEGRTEDAIGTNSVDGIVTMSPITFDMPGEYVYVVSELGNTENVFNGVTYDKTVYQVKASVEDNMAGGLNVTWTSLENADVVFKNVYKAKSTEYQFGAMKVLNGREMKGNEFEFVLKDSQERVVDTAKNQKNGTVQFKAIEFKKPGTYTYTLSEVKGHEKHMKYDEGEYKVVLEVTDDGRGQLHVKRLESQDTVVFINTYEKPEDPKKPESPKKDSSDTGLATNASSWMSLMAVSGIALAGISYKKKKNEDK